MLTDMIVEEEFELKDEEPWYGKQDLEHDLHLAAQLGKTLLDRNHELEQGLQQMYSTNQEQLQEVEYLTKQVDLLRQMNDQHAKVYEQLDVAARDLEQGNHRLILDNRVAQQRINCLTEKIDSLETHMEDLQTQVDELSAAQSDRSRRELAEQRRNLGAQSVSCLKELYDLQKDKYMAYESLRVERSWPAREQSCQDPNPEEENSALQRSIQTLQAVLASERGKREAAEQETELTARENGVLEQRLALLEGCRARQRELEAEVEELRQLWQADYANSVRRPDRLLLPDTVFFAPEEKPSLVQSEEEEKEVGEQGRRSLQRCNSESVLRGTLADDIQRGHERTCIRRAEAVKQRGISLLNEVDAQYSALQVKYEELLRRCQLGADGLSHKAVQTPHSSHGTVSYPRRRLSSSAISIGLPAVPEDNGPQPEYKALFQEIFTCIQKTKEDLSENKWPSQGH
ncbi:cerebellar degeneration-related protein 2-like [Coregonus clupeaformis]|uniref:cerebellar degeneration-related protein 2-like n=1 Tax=Coregonus clupeaformis TaxID=59861 RepID=UPI001BE00FDD|nr:cerebellar degeneration-related protein 2-like [Coregonus clupeaformis]